MNTAKVAGVVRPTTKYVGTACEYCKKAKSKCNGEYPCLACIARKIECVLNQSKDGRRGRKRTLEQLYSKADALDALLESFQSADDDATKDLIRLIRSQAPLDEIVQHTKLVLRDSEKRSKSRARIRHAVMDIAALIDNPPIEVPARPWTNVTDDDNAVSHLISIYFTWQQYGYPSLDQDLFVRDMKSKSLSSQFCSPFLVNCMLAAACVYTDHPAAFADSSDPTTRGLHFWDESARLWALEQEKVNLTNLQALPAIVTAASGLCRDRAGMLYTSQSINLANELVVEVKKGLQRGVSEFATADFKRSYTLALWAAFLVQTEVVIAWSKPLTIYKPSKGLPHVDEELKMAKIWIPYPKRSPEISYYPFSLVNQRIRLYEIASKLCPLVLSGEAEDSPLPGYTILDSNTKRDRLFEVEQNLLTWYLHLPPECQIQSTDAWVPPEPLTDLHLAYNSFRITTSNHILRTIGTEEPNNDDTVDNIISACKNIASIFEGRLNTIGLLYFGIYTCHAASLSAYGLLEYLDRPEIPDLFHTVIVALSAGGRRWTISRAIMRMIWVEIQKRKTEHLLREATLNLMRIAAEQVWTAEDHKVIHKLAYPNYAAIKERGSAMSEMGELLEEYSRLQLVERERDEAEGT